MRRLPRLVLVPVYREEGFVTRQQWVVETFGIVGCLAANVTILGRLRGPTRNASTARERKLQEMTGFWTLHVRFIRPRMCRR